ncbi:hypothetical protein BCIN_02g07460 [Botrytis cinerea B05.10]|uniref:Ubiquitin-like domain-containing protein n=1 Tax=Botryotinia fuckeliana (strain B05.10) TaxID=332648 RepID=A0A384JAF1_BOTFB|nr:hypothetical protein BCIN_02g07460 [Botrytis cinerea B05.10]ATZ47470.1 hypothetical protein BCIN_02g07460 [Botrytis cinerea B05.10]
MASSTPKVGLKYAFNSFPDAFQRIVVNNNRGGNLEIDFHRTIRVPDDGSSYQLPPDLGNFPIFSVDDYAEKLPVEVVRKGGVFVPIRQREALWIRFCTSGSARFAVKVFVGGINAVSGESKHLETEPMQQKAKSGKNQDYLVVPGQRWLDGIVRSNGTVMQFVAVPTGSGYSVEAQMTGVDKIAGLQFEIIPFLVLPHFDGYIYVKYLTGKILTVHVNSEMTIGALKNHIMNKEGIATDHQRFIFGGKVLRDHDTLGDIDGITLHLVLTLRGGRDDSKVSSWKRKQMAKENKRLAAEKEKEEYDEKYELTLAPGGSIHQAIRKYIFDKDRYDEKNAVMFNVQFLAPKTFQLVTGTPPPPTPVSADTYAEHGYPFFEMYNEPKAITGTFGELLKSAGDIDKEKNVNLEVHQREKSLHFRSVKLNEVDEISHFYTRVALEKKDTQK